MTLRRVLVPLCTAVASLMLVLAPLLPSSQAQPVAGYLETFSVGVPSVPLPYGNEGGFDLYVQGFESRYVPPRAMNQAAMLAGHGPACQPPGFPYVANVNTHYLTGVNDVIFICNDHIMTAPGLSGYAAVYFTPPAVADLSQGEARIGWDMSTQRTSSRDWVDVVITPLNQHSQMAYNNTDQHIPPDNIHIEMGGANAFIIGQRRNGPRTYDGGYRNSTVQSNGGLHIEHILAAGNPPTTLSAHRRDRFEITLSRSSPGGLIDQISLCMPGYLTASGGVYCWAANSRLPFPLEPAIWGNTASVQYNHRVYNAEKGCTDQALQNGYVEGNQPNPPNAINDQYSVAHNAYADAHCPPNTWHWDNFSISPARLITITGTNPPRASIRGSGSPALVTFTAPAPAGANLSFVYQGRRDALQVSYDGQQTWHAPRVQTYGSNEESGVTLWDPVPVGVQQLWVRGAPGYWGSMNADGFGIYSSPGGAPLPQPTPLPTATPLPPTATPVPAPPTSTPVPVPTLPEIELPPAPTATPTAVPPPLPTPTLPAVITCEVVVVINGEVQSLPCPT